MGKTKNISSNNSQESHYALTLRRSFQRLLRFIDAKRSNRRGAPKRRPSSPASIVLAFDDVSPSEKQKKMACHRFRTGLGTAAEIPRTRNIPVTNIRGSRNHHRGEKRAKISLTKPVGQTLGIPNNISLNNNDARSCRGIKTASR